MNKSIGCAATLLGLVFAGCLSLQLPARQARAAPVANPEGMQIFKSANCVGCHKWTGDGGGGYGGAAANLRQTQLTLDQIVETVRCGRPSTGMPHFDPDAYSDGRCYGLKAADLPDGAMPPEPDHSLRPPEIQAVAHYVVNNVKDKGNPTYAECQAFFGHATRACDIYQKDAGDKAVQASGAPDAPPADAPRHLKIEAAPDANAPAPSGK